ncbi:MAG: hypothetical protein KF880_07470 [Ferruginibacter sp.]|nr:hypothetical protein [Ferruginibacter sp.]
MASFENHIEHSKSNLRFLELTNRSCNGYWDWQVTTCFYVAVHLVNAHIAKIASLHYNTHESVKGVLNPFNQLSLCKVPENVYLDYTKLEGLSRRSRYLCNHESNINPEQTHLTYDKHFAKAIKMLDRLIVYFENLHEVRFEKHEIRSVDLKKTPLTKFKIC